MARSLPFLLLLLFACSPDEGTPVTEVGRWEDPKIPALFIIYHMKKDLPQAELEEIQKPIARRYAKYPFVIQVTVHDADWAKRMTTDEMRRKINSNELPVGADLVSHDSMKVKGGLVYTWYKNGDYDEFIYWERE